MNHRLLRRQKLLLFMGALGLFLSILFVGGDPYVALAQDEIICQVSDDGSGYTSNPTSPATFWTSDTYRIIEFWTTHTLDAWYHAPSTLGLRSSDGTTFGPWPGEFINGPTWISFLARPNESIPPGTYTVIDSNPATWGCNISADRGFTMIRAIKEVLSLEILYPVGPSPKVFTTGWLFGAKCINTQTQEDLSNKVQWSGTGSFQPSMGSLSRPAFLKAGPNSITLTCTDGDLQVTKDFPVEAVFSNNYARVGSWANCPADAHACPLCPHSVSGQIISGSPTVLIRGFPAARKGDPGQHGPTKVCCGPNTFSIADGDPEVLIDGLPAARFGDKTLHCGGAGKLTRVAVDIQTGILLLN